MNQVQEKAPQGIYVVGVGVLLVGLLSFCCSVFALFGAAQSQNQQEQLRNNPFIDQQMVESIVESQATTMIPITIAALISVLLGLALVVFSAFTLGRKPLAVHMPVLLFGATGWTVIDTGIVLWAQVVQMDAMKAAVESGGPEAAAIQAGMGFGIGFAVCLYGGWALAKIGLFLGGAVYLRKPEIQAHFTGAPVYGGGGGGGFGGPPPGGGFGGAQGGQGPQGGGFGGPPNG